MRLDQHVRHGRAAGEIGPLAVVPRIVVIADIAPGPAVEGARADPCGVVGRQIVAEHVALVDDAPQLVGRRPNGHPRAIAQARRIDAFVAPVGIEGEHIGAQELRSVARAEAIGRFERGDRLGRRFRMSFGDIGA